MNGSRRIGSVPIALIAMAVIVLSRALTGCSGGSSSVTNVATAADVIVPSAVTPRATVFARVELDGQTHFYNEQRVEMSSAEFVSLLTALPQDGKSAIDIGILDAVTSNTPAAQRDVKFGVGCYFVRISWEKHYIGACIGRNVWHLGFLVSNRCNGGQLYFDGHACVWWEKGSPQFGLYNSAGSKWCVTTRGKFTDIKNALMSGLVGVGIGYVAAQAIATPTAGVVVAAFAL